MNKKLKHPSTNYFMIILSFLLTTSIFASTSDLYQKALEFEEIKGDFAKAKEIYKKIVADDIEQSYVGRSLYHIAIISEMYGEKNNAKSYYNMILSSYSNISGLKYLAANGLARLNNVKSPKNKVTQISNTNANNNINNNNINNNIEKKILESTINFNGDRSPYANIRYRHGNTLPLYLIKLGEKKTIYIENGVKGLAVSDPSILNLEPTTSKIKFTGQKIGECEMAITDKTGKDKKILIVVINPNNLNVNGKYLVKGEDKHIFIENLKQVALDNDNISVIAKSGEVLIKTKKEGKVTLSLEKEDGTKINITIVVYKKYNVDKKIYMNLLESKNINFEDRNSIAISKGGIISAKIINDNTIKVIAIKSGKTSLTILGNDGSKITYHINVK